MSRVEGNRLKHALNGNPAKDAAGKAPERSQAFWETQPNKAGLEMAPSQKFHYT